jgi:hypothetical protein
MSAEDAANGGAGAEVAAPEMEPVPEEEKDDGYRVCAKVDLKTLVEKDSEDESLRKYKAALLGAAAADPSAGAQRLIMFIVGRQLFLLAIDARLGEHNTIAVGRRLCSANVVEG